MFKRIAVAIAFSPCMEAILAEGKRLSHLHKAGLSVIHIGEDDSQKKQQLRTALQKAGLDPDTTPVFWEAGEPAEKISNICQDQDIDLLLAAASQQKNLLEYYTGSVARDVLRTAPCSVLLFIDPQDKPGGFKNLVIHAGEDKESKNAVCAGCLMGQQEKAAHLLVVKQLRMYGFTMAVASEDSIDEYTDTKEEIFEDEIKEVKEILAECPTEGLAIDIQIIKEKYGPALARITRDSKAELLLLAAPERDPGLFEKIFPTDLEYLLKDLPCNLLLVR